MSADSSVYLDSSALVKLVIRETETRALTAYLREHPTRVSCALARVEVVRAVRPHGRRAIARARQLLARVALVRLDDALLDEAAALDHPGLRSLDAIHIAAAQALGAALGEIVTYDRRMGEGARAAGLTVSAPS